MVMVLDVVREEEAFVSVAVDEAVWARRLVLLVLEESAARVSVSVEVVVAVCRSGLPSVEDTAIGKSASLVEDSVAVHEGAGMVVRSPAV